MKKVLITVACTIRDVLGINVGHYYNGLQVLISRLGKLVGRNTGRFAFNYTDAGGHRLRTLISGCAEPTVVFESGGYPASGCPLEEWRRVQPEVSRFAATVAYDRAGIGLSAPGPKPRDARQIARELRTALRNARAPAPYVLVGHSFGGPLVRVFAGMFPAEVSGMVLVDPTQEEFINWHGLRAPHSSDEEWREIQTCLAQAHDSPVPEGIPVVLITAMGFRLLSVFPARKQRKQLEDFQPMWLKFHTEWLDKLPKGQHLITNTSGHLVPYEEPELLVRVIRQMVEQARQKTPQTTNV